MSVDDTVMPNPYDTRREPQRWSKMYVRQKCILRQEDRAAVLKMPCRHDRIQEAHPRAHAANLACREAAQNADT